MTENDESDASGFYYHALASVAKVAAFRSMSLQSLSIGERIPATISAYYSLLHLAIMLMYLCPHKIDDELRNTLIDKRGDGTVDPSVEISHADALSFVKQCTDEGLDRNVYLQLRYAKKLREFVNYGPRISTKNDDPRFGPCGYAPTDVEALVKKLDALIISAVQWAFKNSPLSGILVQTALSQCPPFFQNSDLFYTRWCSKVTTTEALKFIESITVE